MKTIFITGASAGIGHATAIYLAQQGNYKLILCARRLDRLLNLEKQIIEINPKCQILPIALDVREAKEVIQVFDQLPVEWSTIDVLINNAGLSQGLDKIQDGQIDDWDRMIDTNIKGLLYVTKFCIPYLKKSNEAQIINIGSIAGKEVYPSGNVYNATKFAVDALNKAMRIDLIKENIKVTAIHPGMVETEFSEVRFKGDKVRADKVYKDFQPLTAEDIAHIIHFVVSLPRHVNINDLLVMPLAQASPYVVNKREE